MDCRTIKEVILKSKMKSYYNDNAGLETLFAPGAMLLICTQGLSSKFSDSWEALMKFYDMLPW